MEAKYVPLVPLSEKQYYTLEDICKLLSVSPNTVRAWRRNPNRSPFLPPPIKLGKLLRWPKDQIDNWLQVIAGKQPNPGVKYAQAPFHSRR